MSRQIRLSVALAFLISVLVPTLIASAQVSTNPSFNSTWERTDRPISAGMVSRTWMWGPEPFTSVVKEQYTQGPGGERDVQYFDKSRMEITNPAGDPNSIWYVTNGLLVTEMTSGMMQTGDNNFVQRFPAVVNVAGDFDDPDGPTYLTINWNIEDGHTFTAGQPITSVINRYGMDANMSSAMANQLAAYGVTAGPYSPETGKYTASIFWQFMTSQALVYQNGTYFNAPLFQNPYYATGLPIDQAWWANVRVGGTPTWVLIQCFERRCLTYNPSNPAGWQVEAGNVGRHYHAWRYGDPMPGDSMTEWEYVSLMWEINDELWDAAMELAFLLSAPNFDSPSWVFNVEFEIDYLLDLADEIFWLSPPERYALIHKEFVNAYEMIESGAYELEDGLYSKDLAQMNLGMAQVDAGLDAVKFLIWDLDDLPPRLSESEYLYWIWDIDGRLLDSEDYVNFIWDSVLSNETWAVDDFLYEMWFWRLLAWEVSYIVPPAVYASVHAQLNDAYYYIWNASIYLEDGALTQNALMFQAGWDAYDFGDAILNEIFADLPVPPEFMFQP